MKICTVPYFFSQKHYLYERDVLKLLQRAKIVKSVVLRSSKKTKESNQLFSPLINYFFKKIEE